MLKRLRAKFTIVNMAIVMAITLAVFFCLLFAVQKGLITDSISFLMRIINEPDIPNRTRNTPKNIYLPYFTLIIDINGYVSISNGTYFIAENDERSDNSSEDGDSSTIIENGIYFADRSISYDEILDITRNVISSGDDIGTLDKYSLRYLKREMHNGSYKISFADTSMENNTMRSLFEGCVFVGAGVFILFFCISYILAKWAVKPVEESWNKQRCFVSNASHELKTPLTVILSNADMIVSHHEKGLAQNEKWGENIKAEALRMRKLVNDLLKLARLDSDSSAVSFASVDLSYLFTNAVLMFEPIAYENGKRISCSIAEGAFVKGDNDQLIQLIEILLDNAVKYSKEGGRISAELSHTGTKGILIAVKSEGEQISSQNLHRIFERFYQSDPSRTDNQSYGLGLSIAKGIAEHHKGRIWAESRDGVNSFYVKF